MRADLKIQKKEPETGTVRCTNLSSFYSKQRRDIRDTRDLKRRDLNIRDDDDDDDDDDDEDTSYLNSQMSHKDTSASRARSRSNARITLEHKEMQRSLAECAE